MGRVYTAEFNGVAVTAQQDLFELVAPADAVLLIHELFISQLTEVADAAEEMLLLTMVRGEGSVTSGSGGSTPTARPRQKGDAAFGGTIEANNTTQMVVGSGALVNLYAWDWNVRIPLERIWTPETRPVITPSDRVTVDLGTTPADSITMSGTITFEELGG